MENADKKSDFVGVSIKIPKAKMMKSKHSLEYKHGDAPKKFLNPLRDWLQSDKVKNMRKNEGYMIGVGGKTEKYEDTSAQYMIENMVITFYLYKPQSKPYQQPQFQQGQGQSYPVNQPQNVVQEDNDPMDDKLPEVDQPPF